MTGTRDADYVLTVKANQATLLGRIQARMPRPTTGSADYTHEEVVGARRIVREIWVRSGAGHHVSGPQPGFPYPPAGLRPVRPAHVQGIRARREVNHQFRDVTWREDHQHAYTGNGPRVMATIQTWPWRSCG